METGSQVMARSWRLGDGSSSRVQAVALALLVFYVGVGYALRVPIAESKVPIGGDEHHYLTQGVSALEDGDLVVRDNYEDGDYVEYYGDTLDPGFWNLNGAKGYSGHSPGAGVIAAPGLLVAGWTGVVALLALSMSLAFVMTALALRRINGGGLSGREIAVLASGFAAMPLLAYSHTLYPESFMAPIIAALFLLAVVHTVAASSQTATAAAIGAISLSGLSIGLHPKYAILLAAVLVYFVLAEFFGDTRQSRKVPALNSLLYAFTAGIWASAFSAFHSSMWDTFSPLGWWASVTGEKGVAPVTAIGQFIDLFVGRRLGVFVLAPVSVLAVGLVLGGFKRERPRIELRLSLLLLATVAAIAGPAAFSSDWHAGDSPLGRYASPLVPALLLAGALHVARSPRRKGQVLFLSVLSLLGVAGTILYSAFPTSFRPEPFGVGGALDVLAEKRALFDGLRDAMWAVGEQDSWLFTAIVFGLLVGATLWLFRRGRTGGPEFGVVTSAPMLEADEGDR